MKLEYNPISNAVEITEIPNRVDKIILTKDVLFQIPLHVLEINVKARRDMMEEVKMKKEKERLRDYIIAYADKVINDVNKCEDMDKLHFMAKVIEDHTGIKREREWTTRSIEEIIDEQIKSMKR